MKKTSVSDILVSQDYRTTIEFAKLCVESLDLKKEEDRLWISKEINSYFTSLMQNNPKVYCYFRATHTGLLGKMLGGPAKNGIIFD